MTRAFLLIGDIGDDVYHVGDEAMFETALAEIASRCDADITAVTSNPTVVHDRYGVKAAPLLGFDHRVGSAYDTNRERRLQEILDGTAADPAAVSMRMAVADADGVLVCGGGNLSASWPHLLYERLTLLALAAQADIPAVLVGQTVGPTLTGRSAARLTDAFGGAAFVGVRDIPSAQLVRQLSPEARVLHHEDDAAQLPSAARPHELPDRYVAFTVHGNGADDRVVERYVDFVGHLHATTGLPVVLVPHTGVLVGPGVPGTDADLMATMAKHHPEAAWLHPLPVHTSTVSAAVLRHAEAVVSARFHPIVFALSSGVPCMGLASGHYTDIKLSGALAHHGMADWRLPMQSLGTGAAEALFDELWQRREELRTHVAVRDSERRAAHTARWDLVVRCLEGHVPEPDDLSDPPMVAALSPDTVNTDAALTWSEQMQRTIQEYELRADRSEEYALSLRDALDQEIDARAHDRREAEHAQALLHAELAAARDELAQANWSAAAARELAGRLRVALDRGPAVAPPPTSDAAALQRELDAMRNTKLFRWTAPARRLYGRIRTSGSRRRS